MKRLFFNTLVTASTLIFAVILLVFARSLWVNDTFEYVWNDLQHRDILWFDTGAFVYQYDDWTGYPPPPTEAERQYRLACDRHNRWHAGRWGTQDISCGMAVLGVELENPWL